MRIIERTQYLERLIALKDKRIIKVITGVRRSGKSTLLKLYEEYLKAHEVSADHIIAVNLEDYDYYELRDPIKLHAYVKERLSEQGRTYVFLDEVQHCRDFAGVIDSLYIRPDVDLYVTGSNAYFLSSDIATLISGRYVEIMMLPLSFKEYVAATGGEGELGRKYMSYLEESSFPYTLELRGQRREIRDYLEGIFNTIVVKDIVTRYSFHDGMMLESILKFIFDNIGNRLSTKKIADTMTSDGRKIDVKTVERYMSALIESFIVYRVARYDIRGRQHLKTLDKYYVVDLGFRYMLLGTGSMDAGRMLENVVYLELVRRGFDVYVGKLDDLEVDFVAADGTSLTYFQVAATVRDEDTLCRELKPLQKIHDHYPKFILSLDEDPPSDYDGIRRTNALDWLLSSIS